MNLPKDDSPALHAANSEPEHVYRYQLVIEGDRYGLLSSLDEIAREALHGHGRVVWSVRTDEEAEARAKAALKDVGPGWVAPIGWCTCGVGEYQPPEAHAKTCVGCLPSPEPNLVALDDRELDLLLRWYDLQNRRRLGEDESGDDLAEKLKAARRPW